MKLIFALTILMSAGCSTVNCNFTGNNNTVKIEQPKTVQTSQTVQADGNTIPLQ